MPSRNDAPPPSSFSSPEQQAHGRLADRPSRIPKPGWRDILLRVKDDASEKNLSLIAAGAAFYAFLAIPSGITALVSLYGLIADPGIVNAQLTSLSGMLPAEAITLLSQQLTTLTSHSSGTLGIGLAISVLVALWSAQSGTSSIMKALDIAYGEEEKRGIFRFYATAFALTVATVLVTIVALVLVAVLPAVLGLLPLGDFGKTLASVLRWPILVALIMTVLAVVYRFAPSRREPRWRWVSWGAISATLLWVAASALFSFYVGRFAHYDKSYGSLGAVVVLLMWLYLSSYAVLLGGELNAEIEHQTARDSTVDGDKPLGRRGARMADSVGEEK